VSSARQRRAMSSVPLRRKTLSPQSHARSLASSSTPLTSHHSAHQLARAEHTPRVRATSPTALPLYKPRAWVNTRVASPLPSPRLKETLAVEQRSACTCRHTVPSQQVTTPARQSLKMGSLPFHAPRVSPFVLLILRATAILRAHARASFPQQGSRRGRATQRTASLSCRLLAWAAPRAPSPPVTATLAATLVAGRRRPFRLQRAATRTAATMRVRLSGRTPSQTSIATLAS